MYVVVPVSATSECFESIRSIDRQAHYGEGSSVLHYVHRDHKDCQGRESRKGWSGLIFQLCLVTWLEHQWPLNVRHTCTWLTVLNAIRFSHYRLAGRRFFSGGGDLCASECAVILYLLLIALLNHDVPLVEFMHLVFTRMPGESYRRRLGWSLLCLCDVFRALINFLVC